MNLVKSVKVSFPILFLCLVLSLPFLSLSTTALNSASPNSASAGMVAIKSNAAGYEVYSTKPGSFLKVQATWNIPMVTCTPGAFMYFQLGVGHLYELDSGTTLYVSCTGSTSSYSLTYSGNNMGGNQLPGGDTSSPGDKMQTIASLAILGGETSIEINDLTKGWSFGVSGAEPIDTSSPGWVAWEVVGIGDSSNPLPHFSTIHTSGDTATISGHAGSLGSFISLSASSFIKSIFTDSNNAHVLARPTPLTATSTGFGIKWLQES